MNDESGFITNRRLMVGCLLLAHYIRAGVVYKHSAMYDLERCHKKEAIKRSASSVVKLTHCYISKVNM